MRPTHNPFSTRNVRPGAIEYLFPGGDDAMSLVERLRRHNWRGQIVGPHGAGKSTLLNSLLATLEQAGRKVELHCLHDGQRRLNVRSNHARRWNENTLVVVDGYEQLGWPNRWWLIAACRRRGCGLLVTSHSPVGLPALLRIEPSVDVAIRVVGRLVSDDWETITHKDVRRCFESHSGNLRETLFALYDVWESRRQ